MPVVSVIIPAYNEEKYISESVHSALGQTFKDIEVIVVDDGSTDRTAEIIKEIDDNRLKYIFQENSSQAVARNTGIENSSGEYIAFLDGDDYWHQEKIQNQISVLKKDEMGLVYTGVTRIKASNVQCDSYLEELASGDIYDDLIMGNFITNSSVMIRKSLLEKYSLQFKTGIQGVEDWDMWLRLAKHTKFYFLADKLCFYRIHENNISKNLEDMLLAIEKVLDSENNCKSISNRKLKYLKYLNYLRYSHYALELDNTKLSRRLAIRAIKLNFITPRPYWAFIKSFLVSNSG